MGYVPDDEFLFLVNGYRVDNVIAELEHSWCKKWISKTMHCMYVRSGLSKIGVDVRLGFPMLPSKRIKMWITRE